MPCIECEGICHGSVINAPWIAAVYAARYVVAIIVGYDSCFLESHRYLARNFLFVPIVCVGHVSSSLRSTEKTGFVPLISDFINLILGVVFVNSAIIGCG